MLALIQPRTRLVQFARSPCTPSPGIVDGCCGRARACGERRGGRPCSCRPLAEAKPHPQPVQLCLLRGRAARRQSGFSATRSAATRLSVSRRWSQERCVPCIPPFHFRRLNGAVPPKKETRRDSSRSQARACIAIRWEQCKGNGHLDQFRSIQISISIRSQLDQSELQLRSNEIS